MKLNKLFVGSMLVSAILLPAAPASAAQVIYEYTGVNYDSYQPPLSDPNHVSQFGPNMQMLGFFDDSIVTPGFTGTLTQGNFAVLMLRFGGGMTGTIDFVNGQIVSWNLQTLTFRGPGGTGESAFSVNSGGDHYDRIVPLNPRFDVDGAVSASASGTWALQAPPVPLPAAFPLLAGALGFLGIFRRRFFA